MRAYKSGAVILAAGVLATALSEPIHDAKQTSHEHTPGTYFGTLISTSTSVTPLLPGMFRAYYSHPIELASDRVREYLPVNPGTFVLL
jgi:hypothetical protein